MSTAKKIIEQLLAEDSRYAEQLARRHGCSFEGEQQTRNGSPSWLFTDLCKEYSSYGSTFATPENATEEQFCAALDQIRNREVAPTMTQAELDAMLSQYK